MILNQRYNKGHKYISGAEFCNIKRTAKKRKIDFSITAKDIEELYEKQNKKCALSNIDILFDNIIYSPMRTVVRGNASVDRIENSKGYTKDNIQLVDKYVNMGKNIMSQDAYIDLCIKVAKHSQMYNGKSSGANLVPISVRVLNIEVLK